MKRYMAIVVVYFMIIMAHCDIKAQTSDKKKIIELAESHIEGLVEIHHEDLLNVISLPEDLLKPEHQYFIAAYEKCQGFKLLKLQHRYSTYIYDLFLLFDELGNHIDYEYLPSYCSDCFGRYISVNGIFYIED